MDNRISDFRRIRRMSLDDLAEASGLSKSTLSELERGITKPMLDSARRIASALDAYESELWPEDSTMPLTVRTTDTALAAAEARIAEFLAREQREAEQRKKQGLILDYAMRGLRHSDEHPDDGRMQAVRALAQHSEKQAGRIAALEEALELIAESCDVGRHDGLPEEGPALCATESWLIAKDALVAYRKGSEE